MASKRITPKQLEIFKAHLEAYKTGKWDYPNSFKGDAKAVMAEIAAGKTFMLVWDQVVTRYVSITSQLLASPEMLNYETSAFVRDARKGFKVLLDLYGIQ